MYGRKGEKEGMEKRKRGRHRMKGRGGTGEGRVWGKEAFRVKFLRRKCDGWEEKEKGSDEKEGGRKR